MSEYKRGNAFIAAFVVLLTVFLAPVAVQAASGNVVLWNKLGSDSEITKSEVGPGGQKSEVPTNSGYNGLLPMNGLAADAEPNQKRLVTLRISIAQVGQKPATLSNQGQQALAGTMVLFVRLEMLCQH